MQRGKSINMNDLIITIAIGFIGGFLGLKLKLPAGMMVGTLIAIAIFNVSTGQAYMPQDVRIITQIAAGAFIGSGVSKKDVIELKYIVKPAIYMIISMIGLNLLMGLMMSKITGLDLITSLFATAPGGVIDMSLISSDMGADTSKVAVLQLARLMIVLTILPAIMKFIHWRVHLSKAKDISVGEVAVGKDNTKAKAITQSLPMKGSSINLVLTLGIAFIFGFVGYTLGIPAGAMTFSMMSVGALNVLTGRGFMPLKLRRVTQVFAGTLIGSRMTYEDIIALDSVLLPAIMMLIGIVIINLLIGFLISKLGGLEITTALLASAPGGMSDMAIIARELGGDGPKVAVLQLTRYVSVIAFFPMIIKFIAMLL